MAILANGTKRGAFYQASSLVDSLGLVLTKARLSGILRGVGRTTHLFGGADPRTMILISKLPASCREARRPFKASMESSRLCRTGAPPWSASGYLTCEPAGAASGA